MCDGGDVMLMAYCEWGVKGGREEEEVVRAVVGWVQVSVGVTECRYFCMKTEDRV